MGGIERVQSLVAYRWLAVARATAKEGNREVGLPANRKKSQIRRNSAILARMRKVEQGKDCNRREVRKRRESVMKLRLRSQFGCSGG